MRNICIKKQNIYTRREKICTSKKKAHKSNKNKSLSLSLSLSLYREKCISFTHHVGNVAGALPHAIPVRVSSWKIAYFFFIYKVTSYSAKLNIPSRINAVLLISWVLYLFFRTLISYISCVFFHETRTDETEIKWKFWIPRYGDKMKDQNEKKRSVITLLMHGTILYILSNCANEQ